MFSMTFTSATHNPALLILRSKGYVVKILKTEPNGKSYYTASANGRKFGSPTSGAQLLGLVTIWEHYGEKWNVQKPDVTDEILVEIESDEFQDRG